MGADEQVDLKFSADSHAAVTALEQIATGLQKMGEQGKKAGKDIDQEMGPLEKTMKDFADDIADSTSGMALLEKAALKATETIGEALARLEDRANAAKEALTGGAESEHSWMNRLVPGEDPKAFQSTLDTIATTTSRDRQGLDTVAAASMRADPMRIAGIAEHGEEIQAAAASTADLGEAAERARSIRRLKQFFPKFTTAGAAAELARTGWGGQVQELAEGLSPGLNDSYETLSGFAETVARHAPGAADSNTLLKMAESIVGGEQRATGHKTNSLKEALDFYQHDPRGQHAAQAMIESVKQTSGAGGLGGRNAQLTAILKGIVGGQIPLSQGGAENAPSSLEAAAKMLESIEAVPTQQAESSNQSGATAHNLWLRKHPEGLKQLAGEAYSRVQQTYGWGEWLDEKAQNFPLGYPKVTPEREFEYDMSMTKQHIGVLKGGAQTKESADAISDAQAQLRTMQELLGELKALRRDQAQPADLNIRTDDGHYVPGTAIQRAGR